MLTQRSHRHLRFYGASKRLHIRSKLPVEAESNQAHGGLRGRKNVAHGKTLLLLAVSYTSDFKSSFSADQPGELPAFHRTEDLSRPRHHQWSYGPWLESPLVSGREHSRANPSSLDDSSQEPRCKREHTTRLFVTIWLKASCATPKTHTPGQATQLQRTRDMQGCVTCRRVKNTSHPLPLDTKGDTASVEAQTCFMRRPRAVVLGRNHVASHN